MTQLPPLMVNLIKWSDLERKVCGNSEFDVDLLKSVTEYSTFSQGDDVIKWFWEVMRELNEEDKKAFLRFTWARNRLPLNKQGFKQRMKVLKMYTSGNPDEYLPVSHTCFFQIELPRYTTKEILKEKLQYAIYNCFAIDGDDDSVGQRAAALGFDF